MKSILTQYLSHLTGYVVGAAAILAGLDPSLVPPQYAAIIAAAGVVTTVAHHSYTAGTAAAALRAVANAVDQSGAIAKMLVLTMLAATILGAGMLSACKTLPTGAEQAAVVGVVTLAAGSAIQQHDTDPAAWRKRASEYKAVALELKAINDAGPASLATLSADLQPLLAKLGPTDVLAANAFVLALQPYIDDQAAKNPAVANTQTVVGIILQAVLTACTAYGA